MSSNSILYYNHACQNTSFCFRSHILLLLASICYLCDRQSWLSAGANVLLLFFFFSFLIWKHFNYFIFCDNIEQKFCAIRFVLFSSEGTAKWSKNLQFAKKKHPQTVMCYGWLKSREVISCFVWIKNRWKQR